MSTGNRSALSFDGLGINGPDAYRSRLATFTTPDAATQWGPMLAAAPEMLAALEGVVTWARLYGLDVMPYRIGCPTEQPDIARARLAIARARGEVSL